MTEVMTMQATVVGFFLVLGVLCLATWPEEPREEEKP